MFAGSHNWVARIDVGLAVVSTCLIAGCTGPADFQSKADASPTPAAAERTPDQLLEELLSAQKEVEETAKLYASSGGRFRLERLQENLDVGLEAADLLLAHADVDQEQVAAARQAKTQLLYYGMQQHWDGYEPRVSDFLEQMKKEAPTSPQTAVLDAMLLEREYVTRKVDFGQAMTALREHATKYPGQPTGLALYQSLAKQLKAEKRIFDAKACCQAALRLYGSTAATAPLQRMLASIQREEIQERKRRAQVARIKMRLGGHSDGYFVIYAHPARVKYMSRIDYHVSEGLDRAIRYVENVEKDWVWELEGWFPRTPQGKKQAYALCQRLIKKNTIRMPVFH